MDAQELATRLTWTVFEFFVIRSQVASCEKYEYECLHFTKDEDEANEVFENLDSEKDATESYEIWYKVGNQIWSFSERIV